MAYFSRKLLPKETQYSALEKEGLAVVGVCKHFLPYLIGRSSEVYGQQEYHIRQNSTLVRHFSRLGFYYSL